MPDHFKTCGRCGQTVITRSADPVCATCAQIDREPQGESVRLFEPAPAQLPGQLGFNAVTSTAREIDAKEIDAMPMGACYCHIAGYCATCDDA